MTVLNLKSNNVPHAPEFIKPDQITAQTLRDSVSEFNKDLTLYLNTYLRQHGSDIRQINDAGLEPIVAQPHIIDADGNLADITTKFNTLLSQLETLGILATS